MGRAERILSTYNPLQKLYAVAKVVARKGLNQRVHARLQAVVAEIEDVIDERSALEYVISQARDLYATADLQIEESPIVDTAGTAGFWVSAWVWVAATDFEQEDEDDA